MRDTLKCNSGIDVAKFNMESTGSINANRRQELSRR
jgi:hypothetical protein